MYAIFLQVDDDQWDYLRKEPNKGYWTNEDPVMLFDNKEDAERECTRWNTATVVEWQYKI